MIPLSTGAPALHVPARGPAPRGGLVVAQEIFGLNANIRALCEGFAAEGFEVLAPAYFERVETGFLADHDAAGVAKGLAAVAATPWDQVAADTQAAIDHLRAGGQRAVFVTGFCWGGTVAWLAACRCAGVTAAVGFYGRLINMLLHETPKAPIALHYGDRDASIPPEAIAAVRAAHPDVPIHVHPAGHGFLSDRGHDHDPVVAARAWGQARDFFDAHLT
jgi:carboxymethylenebutenolidase